MIRFLYSSLELNIIYIYIYIYIAGIENEWMDAYRGTDMDLILYGSI